MTPDRDDSAQAQAQESDALRLCLPADSMEAGRKMSHLSATLERLAKALLASALELGDKEGKEK